MKQKLIKTFDKLYFLIFKEHIGEKARQFSKFFGYLALGEIIASGIGFPVKVLAGRFLGPTEYGKYGLIISLTQFFLIPMIFGLVAAAQKYIPHFDDKAMKKMVIGFLLKMILVTTFISILFFIVIKGWILRIFDVSEDVFWWTLVYGALTTFFYLFDAIMRSLKKYKLVFYNIILNSLVNVVVFTFILFVIYNRTFVSLTSANILAFAVTTFFLLFVLIRGKYIRFSLPKKYRKEIINYGSIGIIGGILSFLIAGTDRFFLHHYLSLYWVGIYYAYINASTAFVGRFFTHFINVFFPSVSGEKDKKQVFNKVTKLLYVLYFPIFIFSVLSIVFIIWMFGKEFPMRYDLVLLFSINNCLSIGYQVYLWFLNSQGIKGIKTTMKVTAFNSCVSLILFFLLIQIWGVIGAIVTTIVSNIIFYSFYYYKSKVFIQNNYFETL